MTKTTPQQDHCANHLIKHGWLMTGDDLKTGDMFAQRQGDGFIERMKVTKKGKFECLPAEREEK